MQPTRRYKPEIRDALEIYLGKVPPNWASPRKSALQISAVLRLEIQLFTEQRGRGPTLTPQPNSTRLCKVFAGDEPLCSLFKSVACGAARNFHILCLDALEHSKMLRQNIWTKF